MTRTIVLFTDFGADDPYVAQVKAVLLERAPRAVVLDLLHSAPSFRIEAAAHLLAALHDRFAADAVFVAVVDPGVGTERGAAVLQAGGRHFVGPDNGLLSVVAARAASALTWRIAWRPGAMSASFHGRDLFAPVAAALACGEPPVGTLEATPHLQVRLGGDDLAEVIYVDHYGNAMTGVRAAGVPRDATVAVGAHAIAHADVFARAEPGRAFWYANSIGLVEIAADRASAAALLGIGVGERVRMVAAGRTGLAR